MAAPSTKSMRSCFQLGLPFFEPADGGVEPTSAAPAAPPPAPTARPSAAPSAPPFSPPSAPPSTPPISRTRALVEEIKRHLPAAKVIITDNRTILLSQSVRDGLRVVRAHQMFLDAPEPVRRAVGHFLAHGDRRSGAVVDAFVEAQAHLLHLAVRPLPQGAHRGSAHDLLPIYSTVNRAYFADGIDVEIGWGQPGKAQNGRRQRRSITFGSFDARARRIVIHPVLDHAEVPEVCVARVVHHEMLHAHHGAARDAGGRRIVHGPAFRADEARFHAAREADAWFDHHLEALLRWRPGAPLFPRTRRAR
jgi:hypothetical protein